LTCVSIQTAIQQSLESIDAEIRAEFYKNIIHSGGSAMYAGIQDRLKDEIVQISPASAEVKMVKVSN